MILHGVILHGVILHGVILHGVILHLPGRAGSRPHSISYAKLLTRV
ncbi:MAG: hypothetical protein ACRDSH_23580 [Pseudonocardiaceae bacterium]